MPALSAVGELARRHDPDRFLCSLFAPQDARETLFTLIAFNHEIARAREAVREPMLALIRLQWWREVVEGASRAHEVATPLHDALAAGRLAGPDLLRMIDGREAEAEPAIADIAGWLGYLRGTAGAFAVASGRVLGAADELLPRLETLGAAYGAAGVLRGVPLLAAHGRCLLPQDVLGAHGLTTEAVIADPGSPRVTAVSRELAEHGLTLLRTAGGAVPRAVLPAALPAALARHDLRRPAARPERAAGDRLRVMLAWATGNV